MATELVQGVDISNYQPPPTPAQIQAWQAQGITHVVVRGSLETTGKILQAQAQLRALVDGGLGVSVYGWYYQSVDPAWSAQALRTHYAQYAPWCYWLDCEEAEDVGNPGQVDAWIGEWWSDMDRAQARCGIYTGAWWWNPRTNHSRAFSDLPLWTAQYDGVPALTPAGYGGWDVPTGKQYSDVGMDRDVFDAAFFRTDGGEDMGQIEDLRSLLGYLQVDVANDLQKAINGKSWSAARAVLNTLRTAGGKET